jgi:hypothetical protein
MINLLLYNMFVFFAKAWLITTLQTSMGIIQETMKPPKPPSLGMHLQVQFLYLVHHDHNLKGG